MRCLAHVLVLFMAAGTLPALTGCGGSDAPAKKRPKRRAKKKRVKIGAKATRVTGIPLKLQNVDWSTTEGVGVVRNSRDPFLPYVDDLKVRAEEEKERQITKIKTAVPQNEVSDLTLIAVITGTAVHKAMVQDTRRLGHILRVGDVVGAKPPMRVVRITRNEIIFRALEKPEDSKMPSEVRKVLLTAEELQELLP